MANTKLQLPAEICIHTHESALIAIKHLRRRNGVVTVEVASNSTKCCLINAATEFSSTTTTSGFFLYEFVYKNFQLFLCM